MKSAKYKITFRNQTEYADTLAEAKKKRTRMRGRYDEICTILKWNKHLGLGEGEYEPHA